MHRIIIAAAGGLVLLTGCNDPVSDEARAQGEGDRAARDACYQAAGFTTGETSPPPADGGNRRGPGGDAWDEGALRAADGTWVQIYAWSEWADDPAHAPAAAAHQVEVFNQQAYPGYGPARAVGRRAYVPLSEAPFESAALEACLQLP